MPPAQAAKGPPSSRTEGRGPVFRTILMALAAPLIVFASLIAITSDRIPGEFPIVAWRAAGNRVDASGAGFTFPIGRRPAFLSPADPLPDAPFSRLSFDFFLGHPLEPQAGLLYRVPSGEKEDLRVYDFSHKVERTGWNRVSISSDEALGLENARAIRFSILSQAGANRAGIRNASFQSYSYPKRARQMLSALFRHQPLVPSSINFVASQRVSGRGYTFILWVSLALALVGILLRRFLLRESFSVLLHAFLSLLILFSLADLRNGVDYFMNARDAVAREMRSQDDIAHLAALEKSAPWFADAVRYLRARQAVAAGEKYFLRIGGSLFARQAARRAQYYAYPARRTFRMSEADTVLVYALSAKPFDSSPYWAREARLPSGVLVYRRKP